MSNEKMIEPYRTTFIQQSRAGRSIIDVHLYTLVRKLLHTYLAQFYHMTKKSLT